MEKVVRKAYVDSRGAIVFSDIVCVDGHSNLCRYRIVTHIHYDHILDIDRSIARCRYIIATPITFDLLECLGYTMPRIKKRSLNYGEQLDIGSARIRLVYAEHIPGSAQVVFETDEGIYAYTGDFKHAGTKTPILKDVDILVVDATYGDPSHRRPSEDEIEEQFAKLVQNLLMQGPVTIYAYFGKACEAMMILRRHGLDAPFIASTKHWLIANKLRKYGFEIEDLYLDGTPEAEELKKFSWYVKFEHYAKFRDSAKRRGTHIVLSGWLFNRPVKQISSNVWIVALSDHADFEDVLHYVDEARPRLLIVDAFRGNLAARRFAKYVRERLGILAEAMP